MSAVRKRDNNWVDGLRGLASLLVVTGHIVTSFAPHMLSPNISPHPGAKPLLFQRPFLRMITAGRPAVALFFIITGYVNTLNPVKNARSQNFQVGLKNLARNTFSRSGRLVIPSTFVTLVAWALSQLGAFELGKRSDSPWISRVSQTPGPTFRSSLWPLFKAVFFSWSNGLTRFDPTHWTLSFFLHASFRVYLVLLGLSLTKPRFWYICNVLLYIYAWLTKDTLVGLNIYVGIFFAQLQNDLGPRATKLFPRFVPICIIALAIFLMSYPLDNPTWAHWSTRYHNIVARYAPEGTDDDISRIASSLGSSTLFAGIFFSDIARQVFTNPYFNFIGSVSFPVYLLHATLMRTVLVYLVYLPSLVSYHPPPGQRPPVPRVNNLAFACSMPLFYASLYSVGYLWTFYVDPICAKVVAALQRWTFTNGADAAPPKPQPFLPVSTPLSSSVEIEKSKELQHKGLV